MQVVFEDVTAETRRHDLMEAYAARVVLGQEEERRHIAQETPRRSGPGPHPPVPADRHARAREPTRSRRGTRDSADLRPSSRTRWPSCVHRPGPAALGPRRLGLVASINQILTEAGAAARVRDLIRRHRSGPTTGPHGRAGTLPHRPGSHLQHRAPCRRPPRGGGLELRDRWAATPGQGRRSRVRTSETAVGAANAIPRAARDDRAGPSHRIPAR